MGRLRDLLGTIMPHAVTKEEHKLLNFFIFNFLACIPALNSFTLNVGSPTTVPLPGTLQLFLTGVGALGLLGWRSKKKAIAA